MASHNNKRSSPADPDLYKAAQALLRACLGARETHFFRGFDESDRPRPSGCAVPSQAHKLMDIYAPSPIRPRPVLPGSAATSLPRTSSTATATSLPPLTGAAVNYSEHGLTACNDDQHHDAGVLDLDDADEMIDNQEMHELTHDHDDAATSERDTSALEQKKHSVWVRLNIFSIGDIDTVACTFTSSFFLHAVWVEPTLSYEVSLQSESHLHRFVKCTGGE